MSESYDVAALRRDEFPWADEAIYLNHAGIGPLPERARRAVGEFNDRRAAAHRLREDELMAILGRSRELAARLIGARPSEIALATNTSYGINLAAAMLPLQPDDVVVVSQGEFPANVFPWRAQGRRGVRLDLLPLTKRGWPDEEAMLRRMEDPRVRVAAVSSVQFGTGYAVDLPRLAATAQATNTFLVVDAIQSLGQAPLDVSRQRIDMLSSGAQKWLLSPWGTGFTYVRNGLIEQLEPPLAGWMAYEGTDDFTRVCDYPERLHADARRFELVTLPFQDLLGMNASLELLLDLGIERIAGHLRSIARPVLEWADRRGVRVVSPAGERGSGFVCVAPADGQRVFQRLQAHGVVASYREGAIRLSPHCYNTLEEMARVAALLDQAV